MQRRQRAIILYTLSLALAWAWPHPMLVYLSTGHAGKTARRLPPRSFNDGPCLLPRSARGTPRLGPTIQPIHCIPFMFYSCAICVEPRVRPETTDRLEASLLEQDAGFRGCLSSMHRRKGLLLGAPFGGGRSFSRAPPPISTLGIGETAQGTREKLPRQLHATDSVKKGRACVGAGGGGGNTVNGTVHHCRWAGNISAGGRQQGNQETREALDRAHSPSFRPKGDQASVTPADIMTLTSGGDDCSCSPWQRTHSIICLHSKPTACREYPLGYCKVDDWLGSCLSNCCPEAVLK